MKRLSVASSRSIVRLEGLARLGIEVVAHQQAGAVAQVLNRMRQVVDQAGGDAPEHRLPLLPLDVLLQLDQPIGHGVERPPESLELVAASRCATRVSRSPARDGLRRRAAA